MQPTAPTTLSGGRLAAALALRDLTDPATGPHAVQLAVELLEHAVATALDVPVLRHHGPRVVAVEENYDLLGYAPDDVTRSRRYTRYLGDGRMLRSHTSAHVPGLLRRLRAEGPDRVLLSVPGVCYRRDVIDRQHVGEPHQLDLWLVHRTGPRLGDTELRTMIAAAVHALLPGAEIETPDSPHPYTTGGREIYAYGVEVAECGLAHPGVLSGAGLGPDASGLAMGLGLDRLVMLVKGVPDIRLLRAADPRVAAQMGDLAPYRPVSTMPAIGRDLSLALDGPPDAEDLGDRVRDVLGDRARSVEAVEVGAATAYDDLPAAARVRMGMSPGQWNVLLRIVLRDHDRSLTDADANEVRDLVYRALHAGDEGEWTAPAGARR